MYDVHVSRDGETLEPDGQMRQLRKRRAAVDCSGNETLLEFPPGDFDVDDIPIGNFFDLSKPGLYSVYVTRETYPWNPAKSTTVESDRLSFSVSSPLTTQSGDNGAIGLSGNYLDHAHAFAPFTATTR